MSLNNLPAFLPKAGLGINPTSGVIQNSGCIDTQALLLGSSSPVLNAETVLSGTAAIPSPGVTPIVQDGILDISMCSNISLLIVFGLGSLTSADLLVEFGYSSGDSFGPPPNFFKRGWPSVAAGVVTLTPLTYRFTASYTGIVPIFNPGAQLLRLKTASVGVTTSSIITVAALRGASGMGNTLAG